MSKKVFILDGLSCASCASKIEVQIRKLDEIKNVQINFTTGKLTIETNNNKNLDKITNEVLKIIKRIEPHIHIIDEDNKMTDHHHDHGHSHGSKADKNKFIRIGIGVAIFVVVLSLKFPSKIEFILFLLSYLLIGGEVIFGAAKDLFRGQLFDENFLMSIATVGAFSIGEFPEGVAVMLFYQIGEFFQDLAVNRSRKSIKSLMDIRPDYATLKVNDDFKQVSPEEVNVGDIIIVKPGEKVPLDGIVLDGESMLDTSALTGESVPRKIKSGEDILSGFINKNGLLTIKVTKKFSESTVSKILDLVENASSRKAPTEQFITKFSRYYTPVVVFSAIALAIIPPLILKDALFSEWFRRSLIFLVVSCPCALVISIPLGFFGGIGGASKNGILVKGGNYLEALNDVDIVIFDKTGTLTKGIFNVSEIVSKNNFTEYELLEHAAFAESYSNHPIATSITKEYNKYIDKSLITNYNEISGHGIKVTVKDKEILIGNSKLMDKENIKFESIDSIGTIVYIAIDKVYGGSILISDEIKNDSKDAIKALKEIGVRKTVMLTGDNKKIGIKVADELGLDEVYSELLPHEKVEKLELFDKQKRKKGKLVFIGDGINDAPVLARADIGIAMGGLGSDAAIEAADIVIMTDEPSKLVSAIKIAKHTKKIVMQNIVFALGIKLFVLLLGALGLTTIWAAVFADVGVALLAVLNSLRVLNVDNL